MPFQEMILPFQMIYSITLLAVSVVAFSCTLYFAWKTSRRDEVEEMHIEYRSKYYKVNDTIFDLLTKNSGECCPRSWEVENPFNTVDHIVRAPFIPVKKARR